MTQERRPNLSIIRDELFSAWDKGWERVAGVDRDSLQGLVEVNDVATQVFLESEAFAQYHTILGEGVEERKLVARAITTHDFPAGDTVTPQQYADLLEASAVKETTARAYILRHIEEGATFGLEDWELDVLGTSCRMAGEFDEMCGLWREDVQRNPLNTRAKELGLMNQYTVILDRGDGPEEVSYAERYQDQVDVITDEFRALAERLRGGDPGEEQLAMAGYLTAYTDALGSRDLEEFDDLWKDVDRAWMLVGGRVQPVASREYGYYDPNKRRAFPDFRLAIANQETELVESIEKTRRLMKDHLGHLFEGHPSYDSTHEAMDRIQVHPECYDVVFAGSLDFQAAGQSLPNEEDVKMECGVKVFLTKDVIKARWKIARELAEQVFPEDAHLFDQVDLETDGIAIHVAGHEIGEPLLDSDEIRDGVGDKLFSLLNEDAATLAITAIMPDAVEAGEFEQGRLETQALQLLGTYLRYTAIARGAEHLEPYYKGMALMGLVRMVDSGFIYFDEGSALRINMDAVGELYKLSMRDLEWQVDVADEKTQEAAGDYLYPLTEVEVEADTDESKIVPGVELIPEVAYIIDKIHPPAKPAEE